MPNETNLESEKSGISNSNVGPNLDGVGQPKVNTSKNEDSVLRSQYDELQKKLGSQGEELGELRGFFKEVEPLMERLESQPELVKAIIDGKINIDLVNAVAEGKLSEKEAVVVSKAHEEVKSSLGDKKYDESTPEEINKMIQEKIDREVGKARQEFTKSLNENEKLREFENRITEFIAKTKDFPTYAKDVEKYINDNNITDIRVAYDAVKGRALIAEQEKNSEKDKVDYAKGLASHASSGGANRTTLIQDKNIIDSLISGRSNPNHF